MNSAARYPKVMRRSLHRQRGAVAIIDGLAPAALSGFVGFVPDPGKPYVTCGELRNRADACAPSAALDRTGAIGVSVAATGGPHCN